MKRFFYIICTSFLSILCIFLFVSCESHEGKTEDQPNDIVFDSCFSLNENEVYTEVNNNVSIFSFNGKIQTNNDCTFTIFSDIQGLIEIPTNTIELSVGNNYCYLLLKTINNQKSLYTICIRRLPIYTVTLYNYENGRASEVFETLQVQEGTNLNLSTKNPTRYGYHFVGWDCGNETKITSDKDIFGLWEGNKHTVYVDNNGETIQYTAIYGEYLKIPVPEKPNDIPNHYIFQGFFNNNNEFVFSRSGEFFYNSPTGYAMPFSFDKDIYVYARWGNG